MIKMATSGESRGGGGHNTILVRDGRHWTPPSHQRKPAPAPPRPCSILLKGTYIVIEGPRALRRRRRRDDPRRPSVAPSAAPCAPRAGPHCLCRSAVQHLGAPNQPACTLALALALWRRVSLDGAPLRTAASSLRSGVAASPPQPIEPSCRRWRGPTLFAERPVSAAHARHNPTNQTNKPTTQQSARRAS
jgi:hypothetical protein